MKKRGGKKAVTTIHHFPDAYSLGKAEDLLCRFLDAGGDPMDLPLEPAPKKTRAKTADKRPKDSI